jgi:hypothetical protein
MGITKLFSNHVALPELEEMEYQTLCKAIDNVLLFEDTLLQEFLNGDLHPLMRAEISLNILGFEYGSLQERAFKKNFNTMMDKIIDHHNEFLDYGSYVDFGDDYESSSQYAQAVWSEVCESVHNSLRKYTADLVIAGISLQYEPLKGNRPCEPLI